MLLEGRAETMDHSVMWLFRRVVGNIVATLIVVEMVTAVVILFLNGKNETEVILKTSSQM